MEGDSLECENELALFVIQGIEKNRQMATRDTELVLWLWRASEYCTKVRGTLHSRASLLVLSLMFSLLPVSPLPGTLLHTESQEVDGAADGEGQEAEEASAPE